MVYIDFPFEAIQRLSFYLAAEEYVARHYLNEPECFFMWQVEPTVIIGRNQLLEDEVNLDYCRRHGIDIVRRKSGGGCVYADMKNIMFAYICDGQNVTFTFDRYIDMVVHVLCSMGLDATTSGRNDIMIDGRKVSGNAFYHLPGRHIVHGTMLYDTDFENMVGSITPSQAKLVSKGVKSVRQHITLLKDHFSLSLSEFKSRVRSALCDRSLTLTAADIRAVRQIELEYTDMNYFLGANPRYATVRCGRIEGCGDLEVRVSVKHGLIESVSMSGDYFPIGDFDKEFLAHLRGAPFTRQGVAAVLAAYPPERYILHLTATAFLDLLFTQE